MYKFIVLYVFNLKRMNKSYMFWVFAAIAMIGVPLGLYQFTKDWNVMAYNQVAGQSPGEVYNVGFFVLLITYFFTIFSGATITNSIANERISKVSDLLTYRVSPVKIVYSKMLAFLTLLLEAVAVIVIECWLLQSRGIIHMEKVSFFMKMIGIGTPEILVIAAMSLIAIFIYLLLYAMVGVGITNQQQMQFAQLPVTVILIAAFTTSFVCLNDPGLTICKVMIYVPFVAPFIIGSRILNGTISIVQLVLSGVIVMLLIALCNYFIVKILIPKKMIR